MTTPRALPWTPLRPDLLYQRDGQALIAVEVKGRPISAEWWPVALARVRELAEALRPTWIVLADPTSIRFFEGRNPSEPRHTIDMVDVLLAAGLADREELGAPMLALAVERWLERVKQQGGLPPELDSFLGVLRASQAAPE